MLPFFLSNNEIIAQKNRCKTKYTEENIKEISLSRLSYEFKRLKRKRKHCGNFNSGLRLVMFELGERLDGKTKRTVRRTLGKPDKKQGTRWIYYWRNMHDYLYFDFLNETGKTEWYYAYE